MRFFAYIFIKKENKTMKKSKSVLAVVFSIAIICASVLPIYAASQSPYEFLRNCGYSEKILNSMSAEMLEEMRNTIGDYEVVEVNESVYYLDEGGAINTLGTISPSLLKITVETSKIKQSGTNRITICLFSATWEWASKKPAIKREDAVSVNWDSSIFYQDGFFAQDYGRNSASGNNTIITEYGNPAKSNQGGIGHFTRLSSGYDYIGGSLLLFLYPTQPMYDASNLEEKTSIHFNYVHDRNLIGKGVSFSLAGLGISIDGNVLTDSISDKASFRFNR